MDLPQVFLALGPDNVHLLLRGISLGKLKTYQLFDRLKTRFRVTKLNQEALRKLGPAVWKRLEAGEKELALELSQAVLISHLDMIVDVLNFLGVEHKDGFFDKDANVADRLSDGWQGKAWAEFSGRHPQAVLLFYLNHLAHEVTPGVPLFLPAGQ